MMALRWGLVKILGWQAMPATVVGGVGLCLYCLAWPDVMTPEGPWPLLIVLLQCLLLTAMLGRFKTPSFAFLYSRGYSRDVLWGHMMLVSCLSVLVAWLPAGLIIWTGLRSARLWYSPYFPIMAPRETYVPLIWLGLSLLLMPAFHYAWIRRAQPFKGGHSGYAVVIGPLVALIVGFDLIHHLGGWFAWLCVALYAVVVMSLVLGGRALHRSVEVRV